jgi:hypothetical protein
MMQLMELLNGKKTYIGAICLGLAYALNAIPGYEAMAEAIFGIGVALGVIGAGHKLNKIEKKVEPAEKVE